MATRQNITFTKYVHFALFQIFCLWEVEQYSNMLKLSEMSFGQFLSHS